MPAVSVLGDQCTGHGCFPPRASISANDLLFINDIPALVVGSGFASHRCGDSSHGGAVAGGSSLVNIDGKALARIGDPVDCGSAVAEGSSFVFSD